MAKQIEKYADTTRSDPRWAAVMNRDSTADGKFYYAVKTTGIYCRPSCGSRTPRPENVSFFSTTTEAERAGFRPCKRCKPHQRSLGDQHADMVASLCRQIELAETPPNLKKLAETARMSTFHLHRVFKAVTGVTPKAYAVANRARKVREELVRGGSVTDAIYEAGYNSNGRFYEESNRVLGMTPKSFQAGGADVVIRFAVGECSLGAILVAASERGVCAILMGDDPDALARELQDRFPRAEVVGNDTEFEQLVAKVVGFVEMPKLGLDLPLDIRGTAFQQRVWQALREIPSGLTVSYSEIAQRIGAPKAVRAVAGACAANVLAVAIPCHRVVRNDGSLSGYRWGVDRKRVLLEREAGGRPMCAELPSRCHENQHSATQLSCSILLPENFRPLDILAFHRRDSQELSERVGDGTMEKGMIWGDAPACLAIRFHHGQAIATLDIDGHVVEDCQLDFERMVRRMLGLTQEIEAFEDRYRSHPLLGPLIARQPGLRVPLAATPFEALTWAVTGQQISVSAAVSLRRKLIGATNIHHSGGLLCYPEARQILGLTEETLRQAGFSTTKAKTLLVLSSLVADDKISLDAWAETNPVDVIRSQLEAVRGIGPWTVNYALLRGFGWLDGSLHGDAAVRRGLQTLFDSPEKISEENAEAWLAQFSPWRALVGAHIWAAQSPEG